MLQTYLQWMQGAVSCMSFQDIWRCILRTVFLFCHWPSSPWGSVGISLLPLETEMLFSVLCVAGRCVAQARRPPGGCKLSANLPSHLTLHFTPVARWHLAGPFPLSGIYAKLGSTQLPFSGWIFRYKISVILPSFWQVFSQMLSFALISPQRRNWDLLSHSKILCFSGVCPLVSCIKNLSKSVFWCSPSL